MISEKIAEDSSSIAEILGRAFDASSIMPAEAAELILRARFSAADVKRVDELLERKRETGLSAQEESVLRDYLQADSVLTILKSKARRDSGQRSAN